MPDTRPPTLLRAGATVGALAAAGKTLGYARHALVAALIGAGPAADALFAALQIPGLARRLFASGGGAGPALVPLFARRPGQAGARPARRFAGEVLSLAALALAALVVLIELAAPWAIRAAAPGFANDPERLALATALLRIAAPFVLFAALAQLLGALLNAAGRFAAAAALPALFSLAVIAALIALPPRLASPAAAVAWGTAAAGALQLAWLTAACRRTGIAPEPARPRAPPRVRRLLGRAAPAMLRAGALHAMLIVDTALASLLATGAVAHLHYAHRVAQLLPSIAGAAAATALLPHLSRRHRARNRNPAHRAVCRTLEAGLILGLPAAAALAVLAEPAAAALFQRGAFGPEDTAPTAHALAAYAAGMPAWIAAHTLAAPLFARGDTRTPAAAAAAALAANAAASLLLSAPLGLAGIALGTALAAWLHAAILLAALARGHRFRPDRRLRRIAPRAAAATLAMAAALGPARGALDPGPHAQPAQRLLALALLAAAALAAYAALAAATRILRPRDIARAWRRDPDPP